MIYPCHEVLDPEPGLKPMPALQAWVISGSEKFVHNSKSVIIESPESTCKLYSRNMKAPPIVATSVSNGFCTQARNTTAPVNGFGRVFSGGMALCS